MKKIIKKRMAMLVVAIFLLLIIINFESIRNNDESMLLSLNSNHTSYKKIKDKVFDILDGDAVIMFTSDKTETEKAKKLLYNVAVINDYGTIYEVDLTNEELEIELVNNIDINITKEPTDFYKRLLTKLGSFSEVYAIKNSRGDYVNTGYQKIYTPLVVFVKDGNILYSHYLNSEEDITEKELKEVYLYGFKLLKDENA